MSPDTENLINNTIGNPAGFHPNLNPPAGRLAKIINFVKTRKKLVLTILAIIFLAIVLVFFAGSAIKNRFFPHANIPGLPFNQTNQNLKPFAIMTVTSPKQTYTLSEKIPVTVTASSGGSSVTAFDTLIQYDPEFLTLSKRDPPPLSDFAYFGKNSQTTISVSAVLKPASTKPQIFEKTNLFSLEFTPKKKGKTTLKIIYMPGMVNDSNILNPDSKDILGIARGVEITIN